MKFIIIALYVACCALTSCVELYRPNPINSPMLREKGELSTTAAVGLSGSGLFNVQSAYAVSNHFGIMADGMYHFRNDRSSDSIVEKLNMRFGEIGLGYFSLFGKRNKALFQCYGGVGYGEVKDRILNYEPEYPRVGSNYYNVFFQPGMVLLSKSIEIAFDLRTNYVCLYNIDAYLYDEFEWWNTEFEYYRGVSRDFINVEPTLTMRIGNKNIKGFLQSGLTLPVYNSKSFFDVSTYSQLIFPLIKLSAGISYVF